MFRLSTQRRSQRRGAVVILAAFLMVVLLAMIAFALDSGYVVLARTQLQAAADSGALAAAGVMGQDQTTATQTGIQFAAKNTIGNKAIQVNSADVVYGTWDTTTRSFAPSSQGMSNAVKVTARADSTANGAIPSFFGRILKLNSSTTAASAVATTNPRDICFVVDLSGSMNNDTDPNNTSSINSSYPGVGTQMIQNVYTDFGYGTYPGASQSFGQPLGVSSVSALSNSSSSPLLNTKQPLTLKVGTTNYSYTVPTAYQIKSTDTSTTRTQKAYSWVMDVQLPGVAGFAPLPGIMPAAKPTPKSSDSNNYNYWYGYLSNNSSAIGYSSYVHYMMSYGRTKPTTSSTLYTPLSASSPDCPYHSESTDGGTFSFPPREMPTHSARRSIIAALQIIKDRNQHITASSQQDWVSIVTFDLTSNVTVAQDLGNNYDAAMQTCTKLQACNDNVSCTATETGLIAAMNLLNSRGRATTSKVVVLLTDGKPNLYSSSNGTISSYENAHPNSNYYSGGSDTAQNAALMQTASMQGNKWMTFPVEIGLQGDADFMNRMYSIGQGKTTQTLTSPYSATGDPSTYETVLKQIFQRIIAAAKLVLVQ